MVSTDSDGAHQPRRPRAVPSTARGRTGAAGEALAVQTLTARGYRVIGRNWHCRYGELDIIAQDGDELVFVEVKTRHGRAMGAPEEALTAAKWRRLHTAAQQYLLEQETSERPYRFDVVAIEIDRQAGTADVRVHRNAFMEE